MTPLRNGYRCDLVKYVEGVLQRNAPHIAEPGFCRQFAHFRLRYTDGAQPFPMMRQRGRHAVEDATAVEKSTDQPDVLLQLVGAVDFQAHIAPARSQCISDHPEQPEWIDRIMHDVKGGDHIVLLRQSFGHVLVLEAYPICHARRLGVGLCLLNGRREVVVPDIARLRVGLSQLDQGLSVPTAHIRGQGAVFQFRKHLWHGRQPHRHQQILKPATGKACHAFPGARVIGLHRDATTAAESLHQLIDWSHQPYKFLLHPTEEDRPPFLGKHRSVLGWEREATSGRVVLQIAGACHRAEPLTGIALVDVCTLRQFFTRSRCLGQLFEEAEAITDARHRRDGQASGVSQHLTYECFGLCLIDALLDCHVFFSFFCLYVVCLCGERCSAHNRHQYYAQKRLIFHWGKPKIFVKTIRRFSERDAEWYGDDTGYSLVCTRPFSWTQAAICAREVKPNLDKMPLTWASTVRLPITRRSAIS